jgi:hypothetical protein
MKSCFAAVHILVGVWKCSSAQTHGAGALMRRCHCQLMQELWSSQVVDSHSLGDFPSHGIALHT